MNYKRFTMTYGKYKDNLTGIEYDEKLESWKICHLLNELDEERIYWMQKAELSDEEEKEVVEYLQVYHKKEC